MRLIDRRHQRSGTEERLTLALARDRGRNILEKRPNNGTGTLLNDSVNLMCNDYSKSTVIR